MRATVLQPAYRTFDCGVDRPGDCVEIDKQGRRL
jgi:hypothetical protein